MNFSSEGHRQVFEKLEELIEPGSRLLDVGCGDGSFLRELERAYDIRGAGVDPSATPKEGGDGGCRRLRAEEIEELAEEFDLIYSINSLHHFDAPSRFIKGAEERLTGSGRIIIADWKKGASTGIPESYYSGDCVADLLKEAGFDLLESRELEKQFLLVARPA
ncbi:MAG: class I SAM-dependent methyltransferase [Candidatus Acetothermia bacterium]